jgi:hypothetical protein
LSPICKTPPFFLLQLFLKREGEDDLNCYVFTGVCRSELHLIHSYGAGRIGFGLLWTPLDEIGNKFHSCLMEHKIVMQTEETPQFIYRWKTITILI